MHKFLRRRVSQNKKRLIEGRYDLDLTYITDRIIAMQFPAVGLEAMYRNSRNGENGVVQYLETRHGDHYRVYNLCKEKQYQYLPTVFNGKLSVYPFPDHNPAPLVTVAEFIADAVKFLNDSPQNVVAVHCKAGRGRTGFMVSCLLLSLGIYTEAKDAMEHFSKARTHDGKALNQPSQIRYIQYWANLLNEARRLSADTLKSPRKALEFTSPCNAKTLNQFATTKRRPKSGNYRLVSYKGVPLPVAESGLYVKSIGIYNAAPDASRILLVLEQNGVRVHSQVLKREGDSFEWHALEPEGLGLCGDIRVEGFADDSDKQAFRYWFNTHFTNEGKCQVHRAEIDIACRVKSKAHSDKTSKAAQVFSSSTSLVFDFRRDRSFSSKENMPPPSATKFIVPTLTSPIAPLPITKFIVPTLTSPIPPITKFVPTLPSPIPPITKCVPTLTSPIAAITPVKVDRGIMGDQVISVLEEESEDSFSASSPEQLPSTPTQEFPAGLTPESHTLGLFDFMRTEVEALEETQQLCLLHLLQRLLNSKMDDIRYGQLHGGRVLPSWDHKKRVDFRSSVRVQPTVSTDPFPRQLPRRVVNANLSEKALKQAPNRASKVARAVEYDPQYRPLPRRTMFRPGPGEPEAVEGSKATPELTPPAGENGTRRSYPKVTAGVRMHYSDEEANPDEGFSSSITWSSGLATPPAEPNKSGENLQLKFEEKLKEMTRIVHSHEKASSERLTARKLPQIASSPQASLPSPAEVSPATQEKIRAVICDLIANETSYSHELQMMVYHFVAPLKKIARRMTLANQYRPGDITPLQVDLVLCNIADIAEFHKEFLKRLVAVNKPGSSATHTATLVCDTFTSHMKEFSMYVRYVTNNPKCQKALTALQRNSVFTDLVNAKRSYRLEGKDYDFNFYHLLLAPVPRLPYYVSVFTELLQIYADFGVVFEDCLQKLSEDLIALIRSFNTPNQHEHDVTQFPVSRAHKFRKNTPYKLEIDGATKSITLTTEGEQDVCLVPQAIEGLKMSKKVAAKCTLIFWTQGKEDKKEKSQREAARFIFETPTERDRFAKLFDEHIWSALQRTPAGSSAA